MARWLQERAELLAHLDTASPQGGLSEDGFATLGRLVDELRALSPYPRPVEEPVRLHGLWRTLFAHFGARHSAGKPREHDSTLRIHSFNKLADVPIRVQAIEQHVTADGSHYDNIVHIRAPNQDLPAVITTHGSWTADPDNRQRLHIAFSRVSVAAEAGRDGAQLRQALGLTEDQPLDADLQVGKLHSDVVYLDDEYRINIGIQGGLYVLVRCGG